jgi:hypothetical protein
LLSALLYGIFKVVIMTLIELIDRANRGIIGIDDDLNVFGGFDKSLEQAGLEKPDWMDDDDFDELQKDEKIALADRMIALWQRYRDAI